MGIFDYFPYTNLHELNLDWIIRNLRGVNDKLDEALDLIKNKLADLINEPEVKEKIDELIAEYLTPEEVAGIVGEIVEKLSATPYSYPFPPYAFINNGKFKLKTDSTMKVNQGACSDGTYFYSYRSNVTGGSTGIIDKYNMNGNTSANIVNWTFEESNAIALEHGNSMFYKKDENIIYVSPLFKGASTPDNRIFKVNPETLTIIETIEIDRALRGIAYNTRLLKWVGWDDGNYLVLYDENFQNAEEHKIDSYLNNRTGLYANDDYIFILTTGAVGVATRGQISESRIIIYDWNMNYRGDVIIHNSEELESLSYTGAGYVCTFYETETGDGNAYASFVQLTTNIPTAFSFYRTHWGQNEVVFSATTDDNMVPISGSTSEPTIIPFIDVRVPYTATHLEMDLSENMSTAVKTLTVPRSYGYTARSSWHNIITMGSNNLYIEDFRVRQESYEQSGVYYWRVSITGYHGRRIGLDGSVVDLETPLSKIREIRACNYTYQPYRSAE